MFGVIYVFSENDFWTIYFQNKNVFKYFIGKNDVMYSRKILSTIGVLSI